MRHIYILIVVFLVFSCKEEQKLDALTANEIINTSIAVSGGETFENSIIRFQFRDKYYVARRHQGNFSLIRLFEDHKDSIFDLLTNSGFERSVNNESIKLPDSMKAKYAASVNSVHYFSVLPYGLNDQAVNKQFIGEEQIKNRNYYKIKVTFNAEGGGEDFEDVFVYWIEKESFKADYLAYSYNEDDDVGMRFREAYNERYVEGLRFVDYNNYKPDDEALDLQGLGKAFGNGQLIPLSKIELNDVEVEVIKK